MTDVELLPCPFCGGEAKMDGYSLYVTNPDRSDYRAFAKCGHCKLSMYFDGETKERAFASMAKHWNTRYERTCHMVFDNPRSHKCRCDRCGFNYLIGDDVAWHGDRFIYLWDYCKGCGAKVVDE